MTPEHSLEPDVRTASMVGAGATGAVALGALAVGALAVGAVAVGAIAIGMLALGEGRIKRLVIDELEVGVLRVRSIENLPAE